MAKKRNLLPAILIAGASILPAASANAATVSGTVAPQTIESDTELTLSGATIDARGQVKTPAIDIKPGATLTLTLEGDNYIYGGTCAAGIHVSPAYDGETYLENSVGKLILKGSGNLTVYGGRADDDGDTVDVDVNGTTKNVPIQCGSGAGIGGNGSYTFYDGRIDKISDWTYAPDFGKIVIDESYTGTLNVTSGSSDDSQTSSHESTTTYGSGAGIGTGGTIDNTTRDPSGGTRFSPASHPTIYGSIEINGGTINASGLAENDRVDSDGGAGIGTGGAYHSWFNNRNEVTIEINGGTINAVGGYYAAGIGGGANQNSGYITITGGTINAQHGPYDQSGGLIPTGGAGIGAGDVGTLQEINITGGNITAVGHVSAGIGGGYEANSNNIIYTEDGDLQYIDYPSITGVINISGQNTKVLAISEDGVDNDGERVKSGAGIGSGAPYIWSSSDYNGYYITYQPVGYEINITDGATVTAFGGTYANGIGLGGSYRSDAGGAYHNADLSLTIDDTVNLFAANNSDSYPALPFEEDGVTEYFDATPLTFNSATKYLVQHHGSDTYALKQIPTDDDGTDATFALSGTTMTVSVDGEEATTHEVTSRYNPGSSFALISGKNPTVEVCRITVEHRDVDTNEKIVDDDANSDSAVCGRNPFTVEISNDALAKNYKFDHAIDSNSNEYNESDFPLNTLNEDGDRVFTIYYKAVKEDEPKDTPTEDIDEPEEIPISISRIPSCWTWRMQSPRTRRMRPVSPCSTR